MTLSISVLIGLALTFIIKILLTCAPTNVVNWLVKKYELHPLLDADHSQIIYDGNTLSASDKEQFIDDFNQALFLERYTLTAGYEAAAFYPENGGTPYIIRTRQGKRDIELWVYTYTDHIDIIKRRKKKIAAYSAEAPHLQSLVH